MHVISHVPAIVSHLLFCFYSLFLGGIPDSAPFRLPGLVGVTRARLLRKSKSNKAATLVC